MSSSLLPGNFVKKSFQIHIFSSDFLAILSNKWKAANSFFEARVLILWLVLIILFYMCKTTTDRVNSFLKKSQNFFYFFKLFLTKFKPLPHFKANLLLFCMDPDLHICKRLLQKEAGKKSHRDQGSVFTFSLEVCRNLNSS